MLDLDRRLGRRVRSLVIAAEHRDRLIEPPYGGRQKLRHLGDSGVGSLVEHLRLGDEVAREVKDQVDAAGECEDVLGLERNDERGSQRVDEFALSGGRRGARPRGRAVQRRSRPGAQAAKASSALHGDRDLGAQKAGDVGLLGQEPSTGLHPTACQTAKAATASAAAAGIVTSQASAIWRTTSQCT